MNKQHKVIPTQQQTNLDTTLTKKDITILSVAGVVLFILTLAVYWKHFDNSFHFDDSHTIQQNQYIRKLDKESIKLFFKEAYTLTPLPANQSYRPVITTSYAFDYWLSKKLGAKAASIIAEYEKKNDLYSQEYKNALKVGERYVVRENGDPRPFVFHISNFFWLIVQGVLMFFIIAKIFQLAIPSKYNYYFALFATAFYILHPAITETINYICARSDSYSTVFMLMAFALYLFSPIAKKFYLYLIPLVISILAKPTGLMLLPILFVFITLFEQNMNYIKILFLDKIEWGKIKNIALVLIIPFIVGAVLYVVQDKLTPKTFAQSLNLEDKSNYIASQPYILFHYISQFFVPNKLTADTDMKPFTSFGNPSLLFGIIFLLGLITLAIYCTTNRKYYPISFGLFWFVFANIPTSVIPLSEVMNDHRMYMPFVGLTITFVWAARLLILKFNKGSYTINTTQKVFFTCLAFILIGTYSYATTKRIEVWHDDESLWYDNTIKSPKNGRGLMNYALALMKKGNYIKANEYYQKALKYNPTYTYLHINLAINYEQMGINENVPNKYYALVEDHYKKAVQYSNNYYGAYYFYSLWLSRQGRWNDAITNGEIALRLGPDYQETYTSLMMYLNNEYRWVRLKEVATQMLQRFPNNQTALFYLANSENKKTKLQVLLDEVKLKPTENGYINLSLEYYKQNMFNDCINACYEALKINPKSTVAYNNICSAYTQLGEYDKAIEFCNKGLAITPQDGGLNANKNYAIQQKEFDKNPTPEGYINKSLEAYKKGDYTGCINYCEKALILRPNFAVAYNNICSAYNAMGQFNKAIPYGELAVKYATTDADRKFNQSNLDYAIKNKK